MRGYSVDDGQGDSGALLQFELHSLFKGGFDGFAFLDAGRVRQHRRSPGRVGTHAPPATTPAAWLPAGLGLNWNHPAGWQANLVLAQPLGHNPGSGVPGHNQDGGRTKARAWFNLSAQF